MKKIMIAASLVGTFAAGLILYFTNQNRKPAGQIKNAAEDAYRTMNDGIGKVERLGQHSMG